MHQSQKTESSNGKQRRCVRKTPLTASSISLYSHFLSVYVFLSMTTFNHSCCRFSTRKRKKNTTAAAAAATTKMYNSVVLAGDLGLPLPDLATASRKRRHEGRKRDDLPLCRHRIFLSSVFNQLIRRRQYLINPSSDLFFGRWKTTRALVSCRRAFQLPRQSDTGELAPGSARNAMVVFFPTCQIVPEPFMSAVSDPLRMIPFLERRWWTTTTTTTPMTSSLGDPFEVRGDRGFNEAERRGGGAADAAAAAAAAAVTGAGQGRHRQIGSAEDGDDDGPTPAFADSVFRILVSIADEAHATFSSEFTKDHVEDMIAQGLLKRWPSSSSSSPPTPSPEHLYPKRSEREVFLFNAQHKLCKAMRRYHLESSLSEELSYSLLHETNHLLVVNGVCYLPLGQTFDTTSCLQLVSNKEKSLGHVACTVVLSVTKRRIERVSSEGEEEEDRDDEDDDDDDNDEQCGRLMQELSLLPIRESGVKTDYSPIEACAFLRTPRNTKNLEKGLLGVVAAAEHAFPGNLTRRAIDHLSGNGFIVPLKSGRYVLEPTIATTYNLLLCHKYPRPPALRRMLKEVSAVAIATATATTTTSTDSEEGSSLLLPLPPPGSPPASAKRAKQQQQQQL